MNQVPFSGRLLRPFVNRRGWMGTAIFVGVLLMLWLPRGMGLDRFVTVDEPRWLMRSGNFYQALAKGDFNGTFQREHPGVTITWAGTAGYLWRFPGYFKIAPGQLVNLTEFHYVLKQYNKAPLSILAAGRIFVVLGIVAASGLAFIYAARLFSLLPAILAFLIIAFDPFLIALSRLLHLDGLVSALMFLSLLALLSYLSHSHSWVDLIISALTAGLAFLTKSPALFLVPFVFLLGLLDFLIAPHKSRHLERNNHWFLTILRVLFPLLLWFVLAASIFFLLWPAMWVDPIGKLTKVFSLASTYASEGHDRGYFFGGMIYSSTVLPWYFYPVAYIWRTTPIVLIGLALAAIATFFRRGLGISNQRFRLIAVLVLFTALFTLFISLSAKKFDRYLLPIFLPLDMVAGFGWYTFLDAARRRLSLRGSSLLLALSALIFLVQFAGVLRTFPYYFNYYNPLLGGGRRAPNVMLVGWGEGLDEAARYLNSINLSNNIRAQSWYGEGCFSYFFNGVADTYGSDFAYTNLKRKGYVVLYVSQWQRQLPSNKFLSIFAQFSPEHVIRIGDIEYARIYNMQDAPLLVPQAFAE